MCVIYSGVDSNIIRVINIGKGNRCVWLEVSCMSVVFWLNYLIKKVWIKQNIYFNIQLCKNIYFILVKYISSWLVCVFEVVDIYGYCD